MSILLKEILEESFREDTTSPPTTTGTSPNTQQTAVASKSKELAALKAKLDAVAQNPRLYAVINMVVDAIIQNPNSFIGKQGSSLASALSAAINQRKV